MALLFPPWRGGSMPAGSEDWVPSGDDADLAIVAPGGPPPTSLHLPLLQHPPPPPPFLVPLTHSSDNLCVEPDSAGCPFPVKQCTVMKRKNMVRREKKSPYHIIYSFFYPAPHTHTVHQAVHSTRRTSPLPFQKESPSWKKRPTRWTLRFCRLIACLSACLLLLTFRWWLYPLPRGGDYGFCCCSALSTTHDTVS